MTRFLLSLSLLACAPTPPVVPVPPVHPVERVLTHARNPNWPIAQPMAPNNQSPEKR